MHVGAQSEAVVVVSGHDPLLAASFRYTHIKLDHRYSYASAAGIEMDYGAG
jgi:hypothetical protein